MICNLMSEPRSRVNRNLCFAAIFLGALLSGCVSPPPPEFAIYQQSFEEASKATEDVLASYAPFERAIRGPLDDSSFDPNLAPFMVDDALAGHAQQIDRGFTAVESYNSVLVLYVNGDSIETIKPQIGLFVKQAETAANMVVPGSSAVIGSAVALLTQFAGALLAVEDRAAFRDVVARNSDKIIQFIHAARHDSSLMYSAGYNQMSEQRSAAARADRDDEVRLLKEKQEEYRLLLARWVLLLDDLKDTVNALQTAVTTDREASFTAVELDFWATELRERAESVRFAAKVFTSNL
ncbi:Uncharacterised protein [Halioglobus japonicus]|nr:Uncharacterised protein [Halioglobus japonicus]